MSTGNNSVTDVVTTPENSATTATTASQEPTTATPTTQATQPTTSTAAPPETTTAAPTTQNPTTNSPTRDQTTTTQPTITRESTTNQPTTFVETTVVPNPSDSGHTSTLVITRTTSPTTQSSGSSTTAATSSSSTTISSGGSSGGLSTGGKIAVAVVVPIAAVALIVVAGLFLWRKRRARKDAKEARKQEIDDYGYNPNNDPTIPPLPTGGAYEMKSENTSGYRGWGSTTLTGSVGNKASTTVSGGGVAGAAYSDMTSPAYANASDTRSGEPLMSDGTASPEGEILGAMGPSANQTRGDVHRGPSNASSSYSAAARSDDSGGIGVAYGGPNAYYEQYSQANPYADNPYSMAPGARPGPSPGPAEMAGQPVIRDNPHRRNTRIENPSPYAQQPGISQNF